METLDNVNKARLDASIRFLRNRALMLERRLNDNSYLGNKVHAVREIDAIRTVEEFSLLLIKPVD